ncbi:MAG: thioredoxin-dependent thiol peroxidase [Bryobacterales bacterium]|nr:thioredoxin-dependent thiol peroxidase [Bryobacterales bacterium]
MPIAEATIAPDIELKTDEDQPFSLHSLRGKNVVLYFYPKADTPGCTTEACEFRDAMPDFSGVNAVVLGISPDAPNAQAKFRKKYSLPFSLLCDTEHAVAEAYGVWVEKSMYGRKYMGIERTTFVIGTDGKIRKVFNKVKPAGHAAQVIEALRA